MGAGDAERNEIRSLREEVARLRARLAHLAPPIETLLRRRGFRVYKHDTSDGPLLPEPPHRDAFYALLGRYSFRLFLRDAIKYQDRFTAERLTRYSTVRTVRSYIDRLVEMGLAEPAGGGYRLARRPVLSFGPTLEWYVAELLGREFGADVLRGVKFRRPGVGGDYDVIARLEDALFYIEVKSSPPKQIYDSEIAAFLDRVEDLAPEIAIFLMDTELRMKDKLVPMFEDALAKRRSDPPPVVRVERELFTVEYSVYIANAKESLAGNVGAVIARFVRRARPAVST